MNKVSIIIPVYNAEKYLSESIESALAQDWKNKEIIIVDDGSKDNSLAIAKSYQSNIIKVENIENSGQCAATNVGLSLAQGDYIQYLDADDLLANNKISIQVRSLQEHNKAVAIGAWARFHNNIADATFNKERLWASMLPVDWLCCQWSGGGMMANSAYLIPRHISDQVGGYIESLNFNNDFEYFSRVVLTSNGVIYCEDAKSYYRSSVSTSLSKQKSPSAVESEYLAKKTAISNLLKVSDSQEARICAACVMFSFLYNLDSRYTFHRKLAVQDIENLGVNDFPVQPKKLRLASRIFGWKAALVFKKRIERFMK
jgi:glycosyltransferase involved in cell wall biosynthesis